MDVHEVDTLIDEDDGTDEPGSQKRSLADLQSREEAARLLADPPSMKRPRIQDGMPGSAGAAAPQPSTVDGALAAQQTDDQQHSNQQNRQSPTTFRGISNTEEQHLLALAGDSQAPQAPLQPSRPHGTTGADAILAGSEEQQLLALAASTQATQPPTAAGVAGELPGGQPAAGRAILPAENTSHDPDLDAVIDELLLEEERQFEAAGAGQAPSRTAMAARGGGEQLPMPDSEDLTRQGRHRPAQQSASAEFVLPPRQYVPPAREVYRIRGASLTVTSETGERVYCQLEGGQPGRRYSSAGRGRRVDVIGALRRSQGHLLSQSMASLMAAVEQDQYDRALAESAAAAAAAQQATSASAAAQAPQRALGRQGRGADAAPRSAAALWVEKYAPRAYIDLLSDEQINREVVRWLKAWDPCVFGTPAAGRAARRRRAGGQPQQGGRGAGEAGDDGGGCDALGRPERLAILIAGPPGLGKTTLAHVCAAHCGYRPVEINASDDRSGASLQARVLDAVEMQSVMGERRPNCVIIDEIDGASGGAEGRSGIAALLGIINATGPKSGKREGSHGDTLGRPSAGSAAAGEAASDSEGEGATGRAAGQQAGPAAARVERRGTRGGKARAPRLRPLMRPIICICNDLYAPALRPLRDVAHVFHFKKPQAERLAQRLHAICSSEGLHCERSTLRLLVERTECDIRSCLNTLQFLSKKQRTVRQADLQGLSVGQKDMTKGAFAVWTELLQRKRGASIIGRASESEAQRLCRLYGMLQDFGEAELVLSGVHENLLSLRYSDLALHRTSAVLRHLGDVDALLRGCLRGSDFGLLRYMPAPLVQVSAMVAGPERLQLRWPRALYDTQRKSAATAALLRGWALGMSPAACAATSGRGLLLEVLPALMHVAAPALRPVSQHLYSPIEQQVVRCLVSTLLCYNLRYCLEPSAEDLADEAAAAAEECDAAAAGPARVLQLQGQVQQQGVRGGPSELPLLFRPAVHRACCFRGLPPKGRQLPAAVRQTISHEADMEAIRRAEAARLPSSGGGSRASPLLPADNGKRPLLAANARQPLHSAPVPLTLAERMKAAGTAAGRLQRQAAAPKGTWLDALKEQRQARAVTGGAGGEGGLSRHKFTVLYKFHEGYTNAVKRPLLMQDLLR